MQSDRLLGDMAAWKNLAEKLSQVEEVTRHDEGQHKEAWVITHAFADLESSFRAFLEDQLPKLMESDLEPSAVAGLLIDIGEELRHILYHLRDPKFYRYLLPDSE